DDGRLRLLLAAQIQVEGGNRLVPVGSRQGLLQDGVSVVPFAPQYKPAVLETEGGPEGPLRPGKRHGVTPAPGCSGVPGAPGAHRELGETSPGGYCPVVGGRMKKKTRCRGL